MAKAKTAVKKEDDKQVDINLHINVNNADENTVDAFVDNIQDAIETEDRFGEVESNTNQNKVRIDALETAHIALGQKLNQLIALLETVMTKKSSKAKSVTNDKFDTPIRNDKNVNTLVAKPKTVKAKAAKPKIEPSTDDEDKKPTKRKYIRKRKDDDSSDDDDVIVKQKRKRAEID
jgi:hypothetical protein